MTTQTLTRLTDGIKNALDKSSDTGELKGRLLSLESRVQHQETRTDARFDKMEAKVDVGFREIMDVLTGVQSKVTDLVLSRARNEGRERGVITTVAVVSTIIGTIFGIIQFFIVLYFKTKGG